MRSVSSSASRARIQFSLPITVLISPLWAMKRYGWASGHDGKVFVEKRLCTRASAALEPRVAEVGEERRDLVGVSMPLYTRVRAERLGKYTPSSSCSTRLRTTKHLRSRSTPESCGWPSGVVTKTCRNDGSASAACWPIMALSIGTSRQPRTCKPSAAAIFSMPLRAAASASASRGRKPMPVA